MSISDGAPNATILPPPAPSLMRAPAHLSLAITSITFTIHEVALGTLSVDGESVKRVGGCPQCCQTSLEWVDTFAPSISVSDSCGSGAQSFTGPSTTTLICSLMAHWKLPLILRIQGLSYLLWCWPSPLVLGASGHLCWQL